MLESRGYVVLFGSDPSTMKVSEKIYTQPAAFAFADACLERQEIVTIVPMKVKFDQASLTPERWEIGDYSGVFERCSNA